MRRVFVATACVFALLVAGPAAVDRGHDKAAAAAGGHVKSAAADRGHVKAAAAALTPPIRATFYYPWFPQTWHADDHFHPKLGRYNSGNRTVVAAHIAQMKYAGLQAAIVSWWGRGKQLEDTRIPILLSAAAAQRFQIAPYYEPEGQIGDPSLAKVSADLTYLRRYRDRFPGSFLHVAGKPVIFVYNASASSCADVNKWYSATNGFRTWYVSMKVFTGFKDCRRQPSSWHQYGPASAYSSHGRYYANASPGFFKHSEARPRLARNLNRFCFDLSRVTTSGTQWRLVTSFNEWGEGTAVEPAREWQSASGRGKYLDLMRRVFLRGKRCASPAAAVAVSDIAGAVLAQATRTVVYAAGDICNDDFDRPGCGQTAALIRADAGASVVLALGDTAYESGCPGEFATYYNPRWGGRVKALTRPTVGNHEYLCSRPSNGQAYFNYFGAKAGPAGRGWYAFDVPGWRLIALNSNCDKVGGCGPSSRQGLWLKQKLATAPRCVLAFDHHPAFTDNTTYRPGTEAGRTLFNQLFDGNAELFVSGHAHAAERFRPMNKLGRLAPERGVVQLVVGTGGKGLTPLGARRALSAFGQDRVFGVERLVLYPGGYRLTFRGIGGRVLDSTTRACH